MKIKAFFLISVLLLSGCLHQKTVTVEVLNDNVEVVGELAQSTVNTENVVILDENDGSEASIIKMQVELPTTFSQEVAFVSQAPEGNWDLPYQEACEEASLITVNKFFSEESLDAQIMKQEIKALVEWEKEHLGLYTDTNVEEVAFIIENYFNLNYQIIENVTVEQIKYELSQGHLIIAPFAGRELGNEYFTEPGPLYHMLVIKGYDRNEFITNDVGTKHGEDYRYRYDVLINAIHDLPYYNDEIFRPYDDQIFSDKQKQEMMLTGRKVIISISN